MLFRWPVRVYYSDTDAGGVVYHASYINFYEQARTEMLRHHHFTHRALWDQRIVFVVRRIAVEYLASAQLDDLLEIQSEVTAMSRATMTFFQRIVNAEGKVINKAEVLIACIDPDQKKPVALPGSIVAEFKQ